MQLMLTTAQKQNTCMIDACIDPKTSLEKDTTREKVDVREKGDKDGGRRRENKEKKVKTDKCMKGIKKMRRDKCEIV